MSLELNKTGERVNPKKYNSLEEFLIYLRHLFAYKAAKKFLTQKKVLEIGGGGKVMERIFC